MNKKYLMVTLVLIVLLCMIPTAYANNRVSYTFEEDVELPPIYLGKYDDDDSVSGIITRATFQVVAKELALGKKALSGEYTITQNVDKLKVNFTWSPASSSIQIGFVNPQNVFYKLTKTGGSYTGTMTTANTPSGPYKVAILNPDTNSAKLNGTAVCEWTK